MRTEICRRYIRLRLRFFFEAVAKRDTSIPGLITHFADFDDDCQIRVIVVRLDDVVARRERVLGELEVRMFVGIELDVLVVAIRGEFRRMDFTPIPAPSSSVFGNATFTASPSISCP